MNKQCFRVIFSKTLQRLVVVSELAKSEGKSTERNDFSISNVVAQLKPLTFNLFCALGFVSFSSPVFADTLIIQADKSALKNQQPIILSTANGIPQVNIQTPNSKGLSHNKYSQFDIAEKGAILNNSRTGTATQLAGQVTANPYLARGEAKVILNEVNSSSPSVMKGYVEVAGGKADVIIANPSGLHCEGCGVINSGRVTLTTGKPEVKEGQVEHINVDGGKVVVSGLGLDNSRVDYTEILTREAEVNAGIWSGKKVTVITGKNTVKRTETNKTSSEDNHLQIIHTHQLTSGETQPQFALDVAELGGMYAGKIHLIGTENGVGVRNAGHIGASSSDVMIDVNGKVVNRNHITAEQHIRLKAADVVENSETGKMLARNGDIDLITPKAVEQQGILSSKKKTAVKAEKLTQHSTAQLQGGQIEVKVEKDIVNRGLINSTAHQANTSDTPSQTYLNAAHITNIGTGRLYGDHIAVEANTLQNLDEMVDAELKSAVIAARERADIGVTHLLNQSRHYSGKAEDGVQILSEGHLSVGKTLDEQRHATGKTDLIENRSGLIQAQSAELNAKEILNKNDFFKTEIQVVSDTPVNWRYLVPAHHKEEEARFDMSYMQYRTWTRGHNAMFPTYYPDARLIAKPKNGDVLSHILPAVNQCSDGNILDCDIEPASYYLPNDPAWKAFGIHTQQRASVGEKLNQAVPPTKPVEPSKPFEPIKPLRMTAKAKANYEQALKRYKVALKEYEEKKVQYETALVQYQQDKAQFDAEIKPLYVQWVKDNEAQFTQLTEKVKQHNQSRYAKRHQKYHDYWLHELDREVVKEDVVTQSQAGKIAIAQDMQIDADKLVNDKSQMLVGGTLNSNAALENINAEGKQFTERHGKKYYSEEIVVGKTWSGRNKYGRRTVLQAQGLLESKPQSITLPVANVFDNYEFNQHDPLNSTDNGDQINLPSSSLYKINPNADSHVLIETDPAFTDYRKWLSSDYIFNALRYEPNNVLKRLGDGYYEQRLVREQLHQLTGREMLGDYRHFEEQYKALMDNGVTVAQQFHLRPGVKLTAEQVKALTTDIVWFETQTVSLKDGRKQQVLVPKLYVMPRKGDIKADGTLIAAENILINTEGDIHNQAQIAGRDVTLLNANNITNEGGKISGNQTALWARQNITNLGGQLEAENALVINAGKEIVMKSQTDSSNIDNKGYRHRENRVSRQALLHVKGDEGTLSLAGENIQLDGVQIRNDGTGKTQITATDKLGLGTVQTETYSHLGGNSNHRRTDNKRDEAVTIIHGQGDIELKGNQVDARGTEIRSQANITMDANQINLKTKETTQHLEEYHKTERKSAVSKKSRESYSNETETLVQGSQLSGNHIRMHADKIYTQAAALQANQDIELTAREITLDADKHEQHKTAWEKTKKSGLGGSLSNGVVAVGYQRNKTESNNRNIDEEVVATQVNAKGNIRTTAQNQLTLNATEIHSGGDTHLQGSEVNINAVDEYHLGQSRYVAKSSGFGMNMVYNPIAVGKEKYKQRQEQGVANGIVGDEISRAEAITDTAGMMMRGIQPYFKHQSHQSNKQTEQVIAQGATIDTKGNLTVTATGGDITTQGTTLSVEKDATFTAAGDVHFDVSTNRYSQSANSSSRGFELNGLNKYIAGVGKGRENGEQSLVEEKGTVISVGGSTQTLAQQGDITGKGVVLVSEGNNRFNAAGDIRFTTATTTQTQSQGRKNHAIGEVATSETERFFGYHRERFNQDGESLRHQGSQVVSLTGNVEINAGKDYQQTSSQVLAKDKLHIIADNIEATAAHNEQSQQQSQSDLKIGQFARVKSPIIDLIQTVERVINNKDASSRLQSAQALGLAAQGYTLADSIYKVASKTPTSGYLIRVESGTGVAHSRQSQESEAHISQGNVLNGKEVVLTARGDNTENNTQSNIQNNAQNSNKTDRTLSTESRENHNQSNTGNIRLEHTDITTRDKNGNRITGSSITLNGGNIEMIAGESRTKEQSRGQNVGVEVGMFAQAGGQTGVGVYATVGGGSQKANGESTTYHNSHLDAEHIQFNSQGDIHLNGTTATAERIDVNAKGDLRIESKQDTNSYNSRGSQAGMSVDVSFGNAWSVSGFASGERGKSSYKQVNEQAGLFAGNGGYHVEANNTHLTAGAIASTNPNNSELSTNRFTFEDIRNESSHKATSASISGSYGRGEDYYVDKDTGKLSKKGAENAVLVEGKTAPSFTPGLPMHSQGSDSSTTRATLTEGKITLNKDTTPTQTSANALGINTELNQANSQVEKPKEVKKLLSEQKEIAQAVGHISSAVQTYTANKQAEAAQKVKEAEKARQQAEQVNNQEDVARYKLAELEAKRELGQWSDGGSTKRAIDTVSILFTSLLAGKSELSTAVSTLSPTVNKIIADETREDKVSNALAHAVWGAIESYAAGGNVVAGAVISSGTELLTPKLAEILYNKTEAELTSDEKAAIISLSSLAGGIAGGLVASSGNTTDVLSDISVGSEIAKNTVTNNYLSDWQKNLQVQQLAECEGNLRCELQTKLYWAAVDGGQDVSFGAGVVASIPEGMVEVVQGTTDILLHPIDTLTALYDLVKEGDIVDVTKQAYLERIENLKTEFERAGASGSFNAGREFGGLLQETIGILAGGAGLAKAGVKVVGKVTTKIPVATVNVGELREVVGHLDETVKYNRFNNIFTSTCSFHGDMEVKTDKGYRQISSIKVGDKVLAKNERTGITTYQKVQAHYSNPYDYTVYVEVADSKGKYHTIVSNKIHPFFTQVLSGRVPISSEGHSYNGEIAKAQWVDAQHLQKGYRLLAESGEWQTVTKVEIKQERLKAYNMTVEKDHTYFIKGAKADNEGVWVHNDCWHALPNDAKQVKNIDGYKAYQFTDPKDGKVVTVVQKDLNRFETPNHQAGVDPHFNRLSQQIDAETGRYLSTDNPVDGLYNRAYLRSETLQKIYANYEKLPNGNYRNKLTRQEIEQPIDIGHMYGWEHRRLSLAAKELNWSQKQFNDYVNARPERFRLENMSENRSHKNEMPGRDNIEPIIRDMKKFEKGKK